MSRIEKRPVRGAAFTMIEPLVGIASHRSAPACGSESL
jgi:hypothetical protein